MVTSLQRCTALKSEKGASVLQTDIAEFILGPCLITRREALVNKEKNEFSTILLWRNMIFIQICYYREALHSLTSLHVQNRERLGIRTKYYFGDTMSWHRYACKLMDFPQCFFKKPLRLHINWY